MGGLHDDGDVEAGFADFGQHAHAVEAGHHQIEHHGVDRLRVRRGQRGDGGIAAIDDDGLIAAFLHHVFDQAARYRIVIGNQNGGSHGIPRALHLSRIGALSPMPINACLTLAVASRPYLQRAAVAHVERHIEDDHEADIGDPAMLLQQSRDEVGGEAHQGNG